MITTCILGLVWIALVIITVRHEFWQLIIALPGSLAFIFGLVGSAPENKIVKTKIDDGTGVRNVQRLIRRGNLWWVPSGEMYVYYTPTHWARF